MVSKKCWTASSASIISDFNRKSDIKPQLIAIPGNNIFSNLLMVVAAVIKLTGE